MAGPKEVVLDASVVCKWFLPEADSRAALEVRDAHIEGAVRIVAPDLLCFEVANVLLHTRGFGAEASSRAIRNLIELQLTLVRPTTELLSSALALARRLKLTAYDACYLALAEELDCALLTGDSRLLAASEHAQSIERWREEG